MPCAVLPSFFGCSLTWTSLPPMFVPLMVRMVSQLVQWDGDHGAVVVDFEFPNIPSRKIGALRRRADNMVGGDFVCTANIDGDMPISPAGIPVPVFPV